MSRGIKLLIGSWLLVAALLLGSLFVTRDQDEDNPIHQAAALGNLPEVKRLLDHKPSLARLKDNTGRTALHRASAQGRIEVAALLLARGADVDARNKAGATPLRWAVTSGNVELVRLLLDKGANVNARTKGRSTPLMRAMENARAEIGELLIARGAKVNESDSSGQTALHYAVERSDPRLVDLLIQQGADVNVANQHGTTPLRIAAWAEDKDLMELLTAHGAKVDVFVAAGEGMISQLASLLQATTGLARARDEKDRTPLHWAVRGGQSEAVDLLVKQGADLDAKDERSFTPLYFALNPRRRPVAGKLFGKCGP